MGIVRRTLLLGALALCCAEVAPVRAETPRSAFWRSLTEPNQRRAEQLVRQGRAQLYPALGLGLLFGLEASAHRRVAIENALARFERAVELAPDHLEARLLLGKALAMRDGPQRDAASGSDARAIVVLEQLRERAPLYEAEEVALTLGNVRMRAGDFARSADEYGRALAMSTDDADQAMLLGNLAEATMMQGDLTRALALYERAVRIGQDEGRVLALWGAAVALDRAGEHTEAIARATRALREDRAPFAVLRQSGVFFVPTYEAYYYEALGALALAHAEREGSETLEQTLQRSKLWVKSAPTEALARFGRVVHELRDAGRGEVAARWLGRTAAGSGRSRVVVPGTRPSAERAPAEELPATTEGRALFWSLRALAAFTRYEQRAGSSGRYGEDAREHVRSLSRMLAR
jgi:tetratricopeptide (TPR) repeat protein